jgi:3-oxoacyl-[acyl-carrier protein] reductase
MNLGLTDRVALVTGARTGIGAAIAEGLAAEGCHVAIVDRTVDEEARATARLIETHGCRCHLMETDVRDFAAAEARVRETLATLGRLDILICNAGITADAPIWKLTEDQWDAVIDVNLKGYFNYNRAAAAVFKDQRRGKIVNVASINGLRGKHAQTNYSASKGGIIAMSKALAREVGKFGVNVNVIAPGMVLTTMAEQLPPEFLEQAIDEAVLGRLGSPEDCANAVAFLCSDRARHITGEILKVDGGQYI